MYAYGTKFHKRILTLIMFAILYYFQDSLNLPQPHITLLFAFHKLIFPPCLSIPVFISPRKQRNPIPSKHPQPINKLSLTTYLDFNYREGNYLRKKMFKEMIHVTLFL